MDSILKDGNWLDDELYHYVSLVYEFLFGK